MNIIRNGATRILRSLLNPKFLLGLLMLYLLANFSIVGITSRVMWGLPLSPIIFLGTALYAPYTAGVSAVIASIAYLIILSILFHFRRTINDFLAQHILPVILGHGWSAWAMLWLWFSLYLMSLQPIMRNLSIGIGGFGNPNNISGVISLPLISIIIALMIFHHYALKSDTFPRIGAIIVIASYFVVLIVSSLVLPLIGESLANPLAFLGASTPEALIQTNERILSLLIYALMPILVISRRTGFDNNIRTVVLVLIAGTFATIFLSYPAYTTVFNQYVPGQDFSGAAHDTAVIVGLIVPVIIALLTGLLSARILSATSKEKQIRNGFFVGGLLGMLVFATIGAWYAGIIAQSPIFEFVKSTESYTDAEWLLPLANAVNDIFPMSLASFWTLTGIGAILSAIGSVFIPVNHEQESTDEIPQWVLFSLTFVPLMQVAIVTIILVLIEFASPLSNIFITYGTQPAWNPNWNAPAVALSQVIFAILCQIAVIVWLNKQFVQKPGATANHILLNALFGSGLLTAGIGIIQFISRPIYQIGNNPVGWWASILAIATILLSAEWMRLSLVINRDESPLKDRRIWVSNAVLAGLSFLLITYVLIGSSVNLVLVTVAMIPEVSDTTVSASLDVTYLITTLNNASLVSTGTPFIWLPIISILFMIYGFVMAMDSLHMPKRFTKYFAMPLRGLALTLPFAIALDIFLLQMPLSSGLIVIIFLRPSVIRRLHIIVPLVAMLCLAVLSDFGVRGGGYPVAINIVLLVSIIIVYHLLTIYVPPQKRSYRYLAYGTFFVAILSIVAFLLNPEDNHEGGVSIYENNRWTVFDGNDKAPGQGLLYTISEHNDGTIWIAGGSGLLSTYDGTNWTQTQVTNVTLISPAQSGASGASEAFHLTSSRNGEIWYATGRRLGPVRDIAQSSEVQMLCEERISESCSLPQGLNPAITGVEKVLDGIWVSTDDAVYQILAGQWHDYSDTLAGANHLLADGEIVWVATDEGLFRASGSIVEIIPEEGMFNAVGENIEQIASVTTPVQQLYVDAEGTLWYATNTALHRLQDDETIEIVLPFDTLALDSELEITAISDDGAGIFWIGTSQGLIRYDYQDNLVEMFNSSDSGLLVDYVRDVEVDNQGKVWVSSYKNTPGSVPYTLIKIFWYGMFLVIAFFIWRDFNKSPTHQGKRKVQSIKHKPDSLFGEIFDMLAESPSAEYVSAMTDEFNRVGLPQGGATLSAFNVIINEDNIDEGISNLLEALAKKKSSIWAEALLGQYQIMQQALSVSHISEINRLDLMVNPGQTGGGVGIGTADYQVSTLAPFISKISIEVWQALSTVSTNLRKYAEVNDTGDRLSYLASALSSTELAQSKTHQIPVPDSVIFQEITTRWRNHIGTAINLISGSANLKLDLRTRQIHRDDRVTVVLKVENTGRAVATNIRIHRLDDETILDTQQVNRLSPDRSESIEFTVSPSEEDTMRLQFRSIWDDRLQEEKSADYADAIRLYNTLEEFESIPNPYIVGHPVKSAQMFFGRDDVFQFIEQNLSGAVQDRTIVLYGQRRTGKTSLLYQLVGGRLDEGFIPILIDMQSLVMLVETTADFLGEILYQIEQALETSGIALDVPQIDTDTKSPNRVFSRFIDSLSRTLENRRLLLIFDEFELIESKIADGKLDPDILNYFRSLIQHRDNLVFIFAGTHRLEEMSHDYWSILFNIALSRKITFLSDSETRALIRKPVEGYLTVDDLAVEKILRLTDGHPLFTQLLCWALINHCNEEKRNYASINDVNSALSTMLKTGESHFVYLWQELNFTEHLLLASLAQSDMDGLQPEAILNMLKQHGAKTLEHSSIVEQLDTLVRREILRSTSEGALRYVIVPGVFQEWIKRSHSISSILERNVGG